MDEPIFLLEPSRIPNAGIGCISQSWIREGTPISPGFTERFRYFDEREIPDQYLKFCVLLSSGCYLCPENFLRMGVFWYINHAREPNLFFERNRLYTRRDVVVGEELTLYYSDLLTHPKNKLWVRPEHIRDTATASV